MMVAHVVHHGRFWGHQQHWLDQMEQAVVD